MALQPPIHDSVPVPLLPFGGLGLDLAEVRRKVSGLMLKAYPQQEALVRQVCLAMPPALSGYRLLVRLSRETLGS